MEPGILFFGLFFLLLFIGVPIAVSVGITALVFLWGYNLGIQVMSTNFFANIAKFPLLAIPFFILAGFLMDRVGLSRRLVNLLHLLVGPIPGGLGIVAVLGCVPLGPFRTGRPTRQPPGR
jgi:TRAP-type mannitol/chloroaromatic compound transport system permease large subunit